MTPKELKREEVRLRDEAYSACEALFRAAKSGSKRKLGAAALRWQTLHHALERLIGELRDSR